MPTPAAGWLAAESGDLVTEARGFLGDDFRVMKIRVGHAEIAAAPDTPLASGETDCRSQGMQRMIAAKAADIPMSDSRRMAVYTEFRQAAGLCAPSSHPPVSPHILTKHSPCLCGSPPNAT